MIQHFPSCRFTPERSAPGVLLAPFASMVRLLFILGQILHPGGKEKAEGKIKSKLREHREIFVAD
jgi:hypothetical protein